MLRWLVTLCVVVLMSLLGGCGGALRLGSVEFNLDVASTVDGRVELVVSGPTCDKVRAEVTRYGDLFVVAAHSTGECYRKDDGEPYTHAVVRLPLDIPDGDYTTRIESQSRLIQFRWRDGLVVTSDRAADLDATFVRWERLRALTRGAAHRVLKDLSGWKLGECSQDVALSSPESGLSGLPFACKLRVPGFVPLGLDRERDALLNALRCELGCLHETHDSRFGRDHVVCSKDRGGRRVTMRLFWNVEVDPGGTGRARVEWGVFADDSDNSRR